MYVDVTTFEVAEVRRVLKIAQTPDEVERSVTRLNLENKKEQLNKAAQLLAHGVVSTVSAIKLASQAPDLDLLFGQPRLLELETNFIPTGEIYRMSYTQDLTTPISAILPTLNMADEQDIRFGCRLIDDYITAQLMLCSYGLFDPGFKFTDNCARSIPSPFEDSFTNFRVIDLGELSSDIQQLIYFIQQGEWEDVVNRPEYTQLPPELQDYFNTAMRRGLTADVVTKIWCTGLATLPERGMLDAATSVPTSAMIDDTLPPQIAMILRKRSNTPK